MDISGIRVGACYSNGAYGRPWGVRQVVEMASEQTGTLVRFKGVAGRCRRKTGECSLAEFAVWAKNEVILNENSWQRVVSADGYSEEWPG
jgi:hypothetical protein